MAVTVNNHTYYNEQQDRVNYLVPLKTIFKGVEHRSRAEADQHVIMDALDLRVDWEPYGIELPSGAKYLPDAYVRDSGILVEVKRDGIYDDKMSEKEWEAMEYFNDPNVDKTIIEGFEHLPIRGMVVSPRKQYLNDPEGEFALKHDYYKPAEEDMYEYILKILGVEGDSRFEDWSEDNLNFDHIRRAIIRGMKAKYEWGEKPVIMGYRNDASTQDLFEWYGSDKISDNEGEYLWDYMEKLQYRQLSNDKLSLVAKQV